MLRRSSAISQDFPSLGAYRFAVSSSVLVPIPLFHEAQVAIFALEWQLVEVPADMLLHVEDAVGSVVAADQAKQLLIHSTTFIVWLCNFCIMHRRFCENLFLAQFKLLNRRDLVEQISIFCRCFAFQHWIVATMQFITGISFITLVCVCSVLSCQELEEVDAGNVRISF